MRQATDKRSTCAANWWRFREKSEELMSLTRLPTITNIDETWNWATKIMYKAVYTNPTAPNEGY